jgi:deoxycytidylate deaminase
MLKSKVYPLDNILLFKQARLISYLSNGQRPGKRLGAVLFAKRNQLLAYGCNSFDKTHPIQKYNKNKQYLHAEISTLLKRRHYDNLNSCSMVVYREDGDGNPALALPCKQCQTILQEHGIKKVYYSIPTEPYYDLLRL